MDRNISVSRFGVLAFESLSARRAWIEIGKDINVLITLLSLSARRAWIEMTLRRANTRTFSAVALRKESVDRNV